ncbi:MAG: hypothetical protein R8M71_01035 [Alphaproteobacteria bacterium]|nr:hypothetical protein [Alphaproteobacteria bacterium]
MKATVLLTFLSVLTSPAFAAIPSTAYVEGAKDAAVAAAATDATTKANNALNSAKTYTDGKYGKIPTSSTGTGTALIWVE